MLVAPVLLCALPALTGCALLPGSASLDVRQADLAPQARVGELKTVEIRVTNRSSSTARGVTVRDSLPPGYSYVSTTGFDDANAIRTQTSDPPISSPAPTWGIWSIPSRGLLVVDFVVNVGRNPTKVPNHVEASGDNSDVAGAQALLLSVQPTPVLDMQVTARPAQVAAGKSVRYTLLLRNSGDAPATSVFVTISLPSGFLYSGTAEISGDSRRSSTTDPIRESLLPSWGSFIVPAAFSDNDPGRLQLLFDVRTLNNVASGSYGVSVTVTYDDVPAQTVTDQAKVLITK